jgi:hypothetical protein
VVVDGRTARLHELTASPGIHLLLGRDVPDDAADVTLPAGPMLHRHRLEDRPETELVAVRPHGYIGFRCEAATVICSPSGCTASGRSQMVCSDPSAAAERGLQSLLARKRTSSKSEEARDRRFIAMFEFVATWWSSATTRLSRSGE